MSIKFAKCGLRTEMKRDQLFFIMSNKTTLPEYEMANAQIVVVFKLDERRLASVPPPRTTMSMNISINRVQIYEFNDKCHTTYRPTNKNNKSSSIITSCERLPLIYPLCYHDITNNIFLIWFYWRSWRSKGHHNISGRTSISLTRNWRLQLPTPTPFMLLCTFLF